MDVACDDLTLSAMFCCYACGGSFGVLLHFLFFVGSSKIMGGVSLWGFGGGVRK